MGMYKFLEYVYTKLMESYDYLKKEQDKRITYPIKDYHSEYIELKQNKNIEPGELENKLTSNDTTFNQKRIINQPRKKN